MWSHSHQSRAHSYGHKYTRTERKSAVIFTTELKVRLWSQCKRNEPDKHSFFNECGHIVGVYERIE
jgi:hypothetical protein